MASQQANVKASRQPRPPTFFWQGLLIVLPVAVLATVGFFSLRQDKILAQHEATERAQALADELAESYWAELTQAPDTNLPRFEVDAEGQLVWPPSFTPLPLPHPLNIEELTREQEQLWRSTEQMEQQHNFPAAIEMCQKFLEHSPPKNFSAAGLYRLGLFYAEQGNKPAATATLQSLLERFPRALGESGLPLGPLA